MDIKIAANTYLGPRSHPDYSPTYVIITEMCTYAGPSLEECKRLLLEKEDYSAIFFYGEAPERVIVKLYNTLHEILGDAGFK